jgi:HK97 gp10 family phage protein
MSIKIEGLDKLVKDLEKFGKEGTKEAVTAITNSAINIELNAISKLPNEYNFIAQRIDKVFSNGGLTAKVGPQGGEDIFAYVEFGTGQNFLNLVASNPQNYDSDVKDLARNFYKNGLGTLPATPYLFPSFFEERPKLIESLKKRIEQLASKV